MILRYTILDARWWPALHKQGDGGIYSWVYSKTAAYPPHQRGTPTVSGATVLL